MNTEPQTLEVEVITPDPALVKFASKTGLEKQSTETLVEAFRPIFAKAREAIAQAAGVAESVKDATCVREIAKSRACRLALRKVRLESDETRKKHKEHALLYGKAVDGFHNILMADVSPLETALKEAEDIAERAEAKRLADLHAARVAELLPLSDTPILGSLADLSEPDYQKMLSNAKMLRQAKLDAAAKAEADRLAKEESERVERERLAAENARLQAEAVQREAAAKAEREAAEKELAEERAEAARVAAEIKAKADAEAKAAAEQAARERAEIEAKAKAEAERIAEVARREQAERVAEAKAQAEERARVERIEAENQRQALLKKHAEEKAAEKLASEKLANERAAIEAEAAKVRAELAAKEKVQAEAAAKVEAEKKAAAAAAKKAAAAPDNSKLKAFAELVRRLPLPTLSNQTKESALVSAVGRLVSWVESAASDELL